MYALLSLSYYISPYFRNRVYILRFSRGPETNQNTTIHWISWEITSQKYCDDTIVELECYPMYIQTRLNDNRPQ